ncbi:MAG: hypothetical protein JEZ05_08200 [Tenericutes bacterium]|nr:hypothetical protein [Mycoplasmatota bacterium]
MEKPKATNKECYFYNKKYDNYCRASSQACCKNCKLFKRKDDTRQIILDKQYQETRNLLYYPSGSMR